MNLTRTLVASNNPDDLNHSKRETEKNKKAQKQKEKDPMEFWYVGFFVHKSIPRNRWHIVYNDDNAGIAAALYLMTENGEIAIHNVYNVNQPASPDQPPRRIDVDSLVSRMTASGRNIVLGDFNLHDPTWSGPLFKATNGSAAAKNLRCGMMEEAKMRLLTKPGTVTYSSGKVSDDADDKSNASCLDLTFVSPDLFHQVDLDHCGVFPQNPWEPSDHRPIRTTIDITPLRDDTKWFLWKDCDDKVYQKQLEPGIKALHVMKLESKEDADLILDKIHDCLNEAIRIAVPSRLAHPPPPKQTMDCDIREALFGDGSSNVGPVPESTAEKSKTYRQHVEKMETLCGLFKTMGLGKAQCIPKIVPRMPDLRDSSGELCTTEEQKQWCIRQDIWPNTSEISDPKALELPSQESEQESRSMETPVTEKALKGMIMSLSTEKAAGDDKIPNDALKRGCDILAPILTKIFNLCLKTGHHPKVWKMAITSMVPKPDKESYDTAKAWRPIALLPSIGKLYEKVLADWLTRFAIEHELIPHSQYGAPGKTTVMAIEEIIRIIQGALSRKEQGKRNKIIKNKATLLGLDISGAYNHVDRSILLQRLIDTVLKLPRSLSEPFHVNIGIPQGSPLSPILFILFTAPLLDKIKEHNNAFGDKNVTVYCIAYVDDTYLIAVSDSYERNCVALKSFHDVVLAWADSVGLEFSPHKYSVMHFQRRYARGGPPDAMPDIDGLKDNPDCLKRTSLRVLGVIFDPRLTFAEHITKIEAEVTDALRAFRRVCGSTWGLTLKEARKWYFAYIRPKISYACAAWFIYTPPSLGDRVQLPSPLTVTQLGRLQTLQNKCLVLISGAIRTTKRETIQKELAIDSIGTFLWRTMIISRARALGTRTELEPQDPESNETAYRILDKQALELLQKAKESWLAKNSDTDNSWDESAGIRKAAIKKQALLRTVELVAEAWDDTIREHIAKHKTFTLPVAMVGGAGLHNLQYYKGFNRAESSLGLHLRTECIGLNGYLNKICVRREVKVPGSDDIILKLVAPECSCGYPIQTVYHMFMHCPDLHEARKRLIDKIGGPLDWDQLLTKHLKIAVHWAMTYFDLSQFMVARLHSMFEAGNEDS
ncbi:hypothetical protein FPSE5266_20143 [Fusarium pseudograminearum]|nr:hypothetical protein FPSE5266_20143 [Fusarium pseudograminearum]